MHQGWTSAHTTLLKNPLHVTHWPWRRSKAFRGLQRVLKRGESGKHWKLVQSCWKVNMGQCDIFLFWSKDHTTSKQAFFWMRHKGEDKFGAQLDLPHFENQKKKDVSVHRFHFQLKPSIWISVWFAVMLCLDLHVFNIYIYFRVYMYICLCLVFAYL